MPSLITSRHNRQISRASILSAWRMEEASGSRADSGPNALTLTDTNTCGQRAGLFGTASPGPYAADFISANSEHLDSSSATLSLPHTTAHTIVIWFYLDEVATANATYGRGLMGYHNGDIDGDYFISVKTNGAIRYMHWESNGDATNSRQTSSTGIVVINNWYMMACRYDGAGNYALDLGKVGTDLVLTSQALGAPSNLQGWGTGKFSIGTAWTSGGATYNWDGAIAPVTMASRYYATDELNDLYRSQSGMEMY